LFSANIKVFDGNHSILVDFDSYGDLPDSLEGHIRYEDKADVIGRRRSIRPGTVRRGMSFWGDFQRTSGKIWVWTPM
jgi:hypothetical protein